MEPQVYFAIAAVLVVLGLAGTVLPVLPGILLVFGGLFLAAWADGFRHVGAVGLSIIGVLALLAFAADLAASLLGAKRVGASPLALAGAAAGGIVGVFLGIPGLIFGPFVGAVAGEYLARGRVVQAGKVGLGTWIGLILAALAKVVIAITMIGVFIALYVFSA
jgi:uncharacterized protein YqgC (DUF456 family)